MGIGRIFCWPRVHFRLTMAGWLFLLISAAVGYAALHTQSAMLFVMFGAMMAAVAMSFYMSWRMAKGVEVKRDVPDRAWQNQTVHLGYYLRNTHRRLPCLAMSISERSPRGVQSVQGFCAHLPPGVFFRSGGRFVARRRGKIELTGVDVCTSFPFGLVAARRFTPTVSAVTVWPARGYLKRRILHQGAVETSTAAPTQASGGQDEFFGLRDYRSDDNPRWIHWRRSAARTTPVVREMCKTLPEMLWVVLDTYVESADETPRQRVERAIRFAATAIDYALARGYQVALATAGGKGATVFRPAAGKGQLHSLMDALAELDENTSHDLSTVFANLSPGLFRNAHVLVITDDPLSCKGPAVWQVRSRSRDFMLVGGNQMDFYFQDNPHAGREDA